MNPSEWIIVCYVPSPVCLIASIVDSNGGEKLMQRLSLRPGINQYNFHLDGIGKSALFRIFSIEGSNVPISFIDLSVVSGQRDCDRKIVCAGGRDSAKYVKCIAWDLDNTLWDGIFVEDGEDGVNIRDDVVSTIKELDKRGIVSTICSKNDYEAVWSFLEKVGLAEYFVFPQVNWLPKSVNLKAISEKMSINANAIAFVDDSNNERGEVAHKMPMIRIFTEKQIKELLDLPCFNPPTSSESCLRRRSYKNEMRRMEQASLFAGSYEEFLRDSQITLRCIKIQNADVERRCWELVNRTNQLTLAARRYTETEFTRIVHENEYEAFAIRCQDRYGDYGVIGFIALKQKGLMVHVAEFVMSCRVARKMCEKSVLYALSRRAQGQGLQGMQTTIVQTGRNVALINAFDEMPFVVDVEGERRNYVMKFDAKFLAGGIGFCNPCVIE